MTYLAQTSVRRLILKCHVVKRKKATHSNTGNDDRRLIQELVLHNPTLTDLKAKFFNSNSVHVKTGLEK